MPDRTASTAAIPRIGTRTWVLFFGCTVARTLGNGNSRELEQRSPIVAYSSVDCCLNLGCEINGDTRSQYGISLNRGEVLRTVGVPTG